MRQNGIAVLDVIELPQDRLNRPANRVFIQPLQVANPHHHGGKLLRVNVGFQSEELLGVILLFDEGGQVMRSGEQTPLAVLQISESQMFS